MSSHVATAILDWGAASCALAGETVCGDQYLVCQLATGMLVAVADGLGHGPEACAAGKCALEQLGQGNGLSLQERVQHCHEALKKTRGAAVSLAFFEPGAGTVSWTGVGNVEARLLPANLGAPGSRAAKFMLTRPGVLGSYLPAPRLETLPVFPGDVLIMFTDGVDDLLMPALPLHLPPQALAENILLLHGKGTDDALVLVVCYRGGRHEC